jgi:hypothetical protein
MTQNQQYDDYAMDVAAEGIDFLFARKLMQQTVLPEGVEKNRVCKEIEMLRHEREIVYGAGTPEKFDAVMNKIEKLYDPIIKNAVINRQSIGTLPTM